MWCFSWTPADQSVSKIGYVFLTNGRWHIDIYSPYPDLKDNEKAVSEFAAKALKNIEALESLDQAIDIIISSWDEWEAEAAQAAQVEQNDEAYLWAMRNRLREVLAKS